MRRLAHGETLTRGLMTAPKPKDELQRRPNGSGAEPMRSMRIGDSAWQLIRALAEKRGLAVSAYLVELAKRDAAQQLRRR